ncbi:MAG: hypothetical protein OIF58_09200 [Cohaesibacter sp.]|nr:hypothetical protein [Cohaesibacter sp.]
MKSSLRIDLTSSLRLIVAGGLALGLSACAGGLGGTTYGTGVSQEEALLNDIQNMTALGGTDKQTEIDYSSRPGLVIPPSTAALPAPSDASQTGRLVAAADWPQDPDLLRKAYHQRLETMTEVERKALLDAIRRMPPEQRAYIIKNDPRSVGFANAIKEPDYEKGMPSAGEVKEYDRQVKQRLAAIRAVNNKTEDGYKRKYLTQPPEKYRQYSSEVQQELDKVAVETAEEKKSGGFFNKLWPF